MRLVERVRVLASEFGRVRAVSIDEVELDDDVLSVRASVAMEAEVPQVVMTARLGLGRCNVRRPEDGEPCSLAVDHRGPHSWGCS